MTVPVRVILAITIAVAVAIANCSCPMKRAYDEGYYGVKGTYQLAEIRACEFHYYRQNKRFCSYDELYKSDTLISNNLTAQGTDKYGFTYTITVAPDGQSFTAAATGKHGSFTKQGSASEVTAATEAGQSNGG